MYDCRKPLLDALRVLSKFEDADDLAKDQLRKSPYCVVDNFHHQYAVWCFNFADILDSVDRRPLDELYQMADEMLHARLFGKHGWQRQWDQKSVKSGRRWKKLRSLSETSLAIARTLPVPDLNSEFASNGPRIEEYNQDRIPNPPEPQDTEENEDGISQNDLSWYSLREDLVFVCGKHGHVGPDDPIPRPQFWVVDDRYNEERYQYMEAYDPDYVTTGWLADVVRLLQSYPDWGVGVRNLPEAYLLIFGDRLMVTGKRLGNCRTPSGVAKAMRMLLSK